MRKGILLLLLSFCSSLSAGDLQQKAKLWTAIPIEGPISEDKKILYYLEPQYRLISRSQSFDQALFNVGVGYQTTPKVSLWLGSTYSRTNNGDKEDPVQYRIWQQISWHAFGSPCLDIITRTRLEERKEDHEQDLSLRLRQKVTLSTPFFDLKNYNWVLYDELLFNLNNPAWVNNTLIDQNRAFIGISIPFSKTTRLETGYLNQYVLNNPDQMNHVLSFSLKVKTT